MNFRLIGALILALMGAGIAAPAGAAQDEAGWETVTELPSGPKEGIALIPAYDGATFIPAFCNSEGDLVYIDLDMKGDPYSWTAANHHFCGPDAEYGAYAHFGADPKVRWAMTSEGNAIRCHGTILVEVRLQGSDDLEEQSGKNIAICGSTSSDFPSIGA